MNRTTRVTARETLVLLGRTLAFVWPYRWQIVVKLLLGIVGVSVVLVLPWPLKALTDHVVMDLPVGASPTAYPPYIAWIVDLMAGMSAFEMVAWIAAGSVVGIVLIGAFGMGGSQDRAEGGLSEGVDTATRSENQANDSTSALGGLLGLFEYRYQLRISHRINHDLRTALYDRLLVLPMTHFADSSIGDAVYRVMYDTPSISRICYEILVTPLVSAYTLVVVIYTMQYSFAAVPSLILVAWMAAPLVLGSTLLMTGTTRRRSMASREAGAETTAAVEEGMTNIVAVQSLGASERQLATFASDSDQSFRRFRFLEILNIVVGALRYVIVIGLAFYVFFDVANAIIDGRMSAGDYNVLYAFFLQIAGTAGALGATWFNLQNSVAGMKRVFDLLDAEADADRHGDHRLTEPPQRLSIEHVSYSYPDGTKALSDVSFRAERGEMVALVGSTGAGKSTLAYLVPGFVQPTEGRVTLDGQDVRDIDVSSLRDNVAFVFQEPAIFDDTVAGNVRIGRPEATIEEIRQALGVAGAAEFVDDLPNGLDTRLGQAGAFLSVGQKQRIGIARGVIASASILVLDEPTAALDPVTENALVAALAMERERRILIVVAHRLSTIRAADRIVFLEEGEVLESGSHDELMAYPDGAYRRFVELQRTG